MNVNQARYFVVLCEERSFTRAASHCGIAQSSMTNAIKALEREFGGPLFFRKSEIALTALGQAVHPHLLRIAEAAELARAAAKQASGMPDSSLNSGEPVYSSARKPTGSRRR